MSTRVDRILLRAASAAQLDEANLMPKWLVVAALVLQAHFAASYIVPLDERSQREFGGLLPWFWPWAYGDGGPLGQITQAGGFPIAGFFLAVTAATLLALAALAVAGIWVPAGWSHPLAIGGAALLLCLMGLFFGPTKLIPIVFALGTLYLALANRGPFAAD
jgi:hypothetical protein